jgi:phospholipid/cholesterol/gamma-HCH transport system substrate-binding protein
MPMTFKFRYADRIVGIFILIALLFVLFMLLAAGVNRKWFSHQYHYKSRFTSADGLSVGKAIKFKGVEVGEVKSFELSSDNFIDAEFVIYEDYIHVLKPNSILELSTNPLGIGGGLILYPGKNDLPFPDEGSFIPSTQFPSARDLLDKGLVEKDNEGDMVGDLLAAVPDLLNNINSTVLSLNELTQTINGSMEGDIEAGPMAEILLNMENILSRTDTLIAHLSNLMFEVNHAEELVPTLLGNEGVVGGLISNEGEFYGEIVGLTNEIHLSLSNLAKLTGSLNSYSPQIDQLLSKLSSSLSKAEDVMEGLSNNPLIRGGIEEKRDITSTGGSSLRDEEF